MTLYAERMSSTATPEPAQRAVESLACASARVELHTDDPAASAWLREVLQPWFAPAGDGDAWRLAISNRDDWARETPDTAAPRGCFVFDQQILSLPSWIENEAVVVNDLERSCRMAFSPSSVNVTGDPGTRRWRMNCMWACCEIAATQFRRDSLALHAAAVEHDGRAVLISGPKGAGKTTLLLHLLQSLRCRPIAYDRVFARRNDATCEARGMPTMVKLRDETLRSYPELGRGLEGVARPYLYSLKELAGLTGQDECPPSDFFALSPAQFARRLGVQPSASAPLAALVFPMIDAGTDGWSAERLSPREVREALLSNRYGPAGARGTTVIEEMSGIAPAEPDPSDAIAETVPGYRVLLGHNAYNQPDFSARFMERVLA